MQTKKMLRVAVTAGASLALAGAINIAHAAQATATVPITMQVNNPTCTVSNSASSFNLISASSPNLTVGNYLSANYPSAAVAGGPWLTNTSLNQSATISCDTNNTIITSFVVQPGSGASLVNSSSGEQYLLDSSTPSPKSAANGNVVMSYEQVSVNGVSAAASYIDGTGSIRPYVTPFAVTNASGANYTATVVWRPALAQNGNAAATLGNPTGGSFNAPAQIVANY